MRERPEEVEGDPCAHGQPRHEHAHGRPEARPGDGGGKDPECCDHGHTAPEPLQDTAEEKEREGRRTRHHGPSDQQGTESETDKRDRAVAINEDPSGDGRDERRDQEGGHREPRQVVAESPAAGDFVEEGREDLEGGPKGHVDSEGSDGHVPGWRRPRPVLRPGRSRRQGRGRRPAAAGSPGRVHDPRRRHTHGSQGAAPKRAMRWAFWIALVTARRQQRPEGFFTSQ